MKARSFQLEPHLAIWLASQLSWSRWVFSLPIFLEDWGRIGAASHWLLYMGLPEACLPYDGSRLFGRAFDKSSCCLPDQLLPQQEPHLLLWPSFAPRWLTAGRLYWVTLANNYGNAQHRRTVLLVLGRTPCVLHGLPQSSKEQAWVSFSIWQALLSEP